MSRDNMRDHGDHPDRPIRKRRRQRLMGRAAISVLDRQPVSISIGTNSKAATDPTMVVLRRDSETAISIARREARGENERGDGIPAQEFT
jgi:hypothetical protein